MVTCPSVNIIQGLTSIYRWEGKSRQDAEVLLVIKTRRIRLLALIRRVKALHPYSIPEVIALQVAGGSASYLAWVNDSIVLN
ncbi:MAG TPA: divalent-cation tolerance protein CutA [Syntrophobacteria bacterium]|nr:divalent-cation tolerance protein CutA [Syntrophobacteria bacterium]